jgi:hypothetical protein
LPGTPCTGWPILDPRIRCIRLALLANCRLLCINCPDIDSREQPGAFCYTKKCPRSSSPPPEPCLAGRGPRLALLLKTPPISWIQSLSHFAPANFRPGFSPRFPVALTRHSYCFRRGRRFARVQESRSLGRNKFGDRQTCPGLGPLQISKQEPELSKRRAGPELSSTGLRDTPNHTQLPLPCRACLNYSVRIVPYFPFFSPTRIKEQR